MLFMTLTLSITRQMWDHRHERHDDIDTLLIRPETEQWRGSSNANGLQNTPRTNSSQMYIFHHHG